MLKKLTFIIGIFTLFIIWKAALPVQASGLIHAKIGEIVRITENSKNQGSLKWVLKQDEEILETQTGRNFEYVFAKAWEYDLLLNLVEQDKIIDSKVKILVGTSYIMPSLVSNNEEDDETENLKAVLETLPPVSEDGKIYLSGESAAVTFMSASSVGEIKEYQIDANIYYDSDGNWDPADDVDNKDDISSLVGSAWSTEYQKSWWEIAVQLTVVNQAGEKNSVEYEIMFSDKETVTGPLEAKLLNLPRQNPEDQKIHLAWERANVTFLSNLSTGEIIEYRIDKNIYFDSNGDWNPANDIDNINHPSFSTGENFETDYEKAWGKIAAQLTVVTQSWQGSLVQREIVFDGDDAWKIPSIEAEIWADKTEIFVNESVNFSIRKWKQDETYQWDFDGDSKIDLDSKEQQVTQKFDTIGTYLVTLQITNSTEETLQRTQKIVVKEAQWEDDKFETKQPLVGFEYMINWAKVVFVNKTAVDPNLQNKDYRSEWDFGDGTSSTEQSPEHIFPELAEYNVTLKVTDSVGRSNQKQDKILIETLEIQEPVVSTGTNVIDSTWAVIVDETPPEQITEEWGMGALIWGVMSIFIYLIGGLIALILFGLWGYLIYLKIQHPDFTFAELIEEEKHKLFGEGGGENAYQPESSKVPPQPQPSKTQTETKQADVSAQTIPQKETQTASSSAVKDKAEAEEVPAWLRQAQQKTPAQTQSSGTEKDQVVGKKEEKSSPWDSTEQKTELNKPKVEKAEVTPSPQNKAAISQLKQEKTTIQPSSAEPAGEQAKQKEKTPIFDKQSQSQVSEKQPASPSAVTESKQAAQLKNISQKSEWAGGVKQKRQNQVTPESKVSPKPLKQDLQQQKWRAENEPKPVLQNENTLKNNQKKEVLEEKTEEKNLTKQLKDQTSSPKVKTPKQSTAEQNSGNIPDWLKEDKPKSAWSKQIQKQQPKAQPQKEAWDKKVQKQPSHQKQEQAKNDQEKNKQIVKTVEQKNHSEKKSIQNKTWAGPKLLKNDANAPKKVKSESQKKDSDKAKQKIQKPAPSPIRQNTGWGEKSAAKKQDKKELQKKWEDQSRQAEVSKKQDKSLPKTEFKEIPREENNSKKQEDKDIPEWLK